VSEPDISALVVNYNTSKLALDMLHSLAEQKPKDAAGRPLEIEFIFVDNASPMRDDEAIAEIRRFGREKLPGKTILANENLGYAKGMNLAFQHARGKNVLVLNPDLILLDGCVEALYRTLHCDPKIGAVGPIGFWERGREVRLPPNILPTLSDLIWSSLAQISPWANRLYRKRRVRAALRIFEAKEPITLSMLSGACLMLRRETISELGDLFDPEFPLYFEDTDLFRRLADRGQTLVQVPDAHMAHFYNRSGTTNQGEAFRRYWKARSYYYGKWYGPIGRVVEGLCKKVLHTSLAGRTARIREKQVEDLGRITEPPVLRFPKPLNRCLLEFCHDAGFLLAAAMFGEGKEWRPGPSFWNAFGPSVYYFRVLDLDGGHPVEVGLWRFERVPESAPSFTALKEEVHAES
jgi:GT2 family glycosyltransferase